MGCGKTRTLIEIVKHKKPDRVLILAPPITLDNWKREFVQYSDVDPENILVLYGSLFIRLHQLEHSRAGIVITNYESLIMDKLFEKLLKCKFDAVVLDESHKIKTHNSKRTKRVMKLGKQAKYRYCLTGTPILNTAGDIFPQITFLDGGKTFGEKYWQFRSEYYIDFNAYMPRQWYYPKWVMKPDTTYRINKLIEPISMRVMKSECLDLPDMVRQRVDCGLTDEQADVYRKLEKEFVADIGNSQVVTELELTKGLRLQQIVSGYCPDETGRIHEFQDNPRLEAMRDLLESLCPAHKVVVWGCFRENFRQLELLLTSLKLPFVTVHGGVSSKEQRDRCDRFEKDDKIRVLCGHPGSCGVGINLTSADYAIFYSRGFSLEHDLQAEARIHRGGCEKHESIVRIDLVTPHTVDEVILNALASKQNLSEAILQHAKLRKDQSWNLQLPNRLKV